MEVNVSGMEAKKVKGRKLPDLPILFVKKKSKNKSYKIVTKLFQCSQRIMKLKGGGFVIKISFNDEVFIETI